MMSLPFGLFTQVSGSGPLGPFVIMPCLKNKQVFWLFGDLVTLLFVGCRTYSRPDKPSRKGQSVGHLTRRSEAQGSIPGLATYFPFSLR